MDYNNYFEWRFEFPEVLNDNGDYVGFDVVIGNPQYIGETGNRELFNIIKQLSILNEFAIGKMNYFYFFFHLALNITKDSGIISFITTNYYITSLGARKLREDFYNRATIKKLINFNELKIFESATGQHDMITILQKGKNNNGLASTIITHRKGIVTSETLKTILSGNDSETDYYQVAQKDLYDGDEYYIRLISKSIDPIQIMLENIKNEGIKLGDICNVVNGILTGADKLNKYQVDRYKIDINIGNGIFILDSNNYYDNKIISEILNSEIESKYLKPYFKNSDIYKWNTLSNSNKKIIYINKITDNIDELPIIKNHLLKYKSIIGVASDNFPYLYRPRNEKYFIGSKIVVPQRNKNNIFGYNEIQWYATSDVYYITQKDKSISLKYILALLNSKLYYLWLYYRGKRKVEYLELFQKPLSEIPIKVVSSIEQQPFIDLVDKILSAKKTDPNADTTDLDHEIDHLVYQLYELTDTEKYMIENNK